MIATMSLSHASCMQVVGHLAASVSVAANVTVTEWRMRGWRDAGAVKQILAGAAYLVIAICGALEFVARAICFLVLLPVGAGLFFLKRCCGWRRGMIDFVVGFTLTMGETALITAATAMDALCCLRYSCTDPKMIYLNRTIQVNKAIGLFQKT
jgi:hypothetical protein